jgi:hypothetical protein
MSILSLRKSFGAIVAIVTCALLTGGTPQRACADEHQGVVRTFLVVVSTTSSLDFLSDDSIAIVVAPPSDGTQDFLRFVDFDSDSGFGNSDPAFDSTVWAYQDAMHVSQGGARIPGGVAWLLTEETPTPPPIGAFTLTGPDSSLVQIVRYRRLCEGGDCAFDSANDGKYLTVDPEAAADDLIVVVTAVFSR